MPSVDAWQGNTFPLTAYLDDVDRGRDTGHIISDKSTSITPIRGGSAQSATVVRIEFLTQPVEVDAGGGSTAICDTLVLGYKGHPTIADTNLQRGDRFIVDGQQYEVVAVEPGNADRLHAYCKARN